MAGGLRAACSANGVSMKTINAAFLAAINPAQRQRIIKALALHYGTTEQDALAEVTGDDSEHLLDYLVEPVRSEASVLMQAHGFH